METFAASISLLKHLLTDIPMRRQNNLKYLYRKPIIQLEKENTLYITFVHPYPFVNLNSGPVGENKSRTHESIIAHDARFSLQNLSILVYPLKSERRGCREITISRIESQTAG